MSKSLSSTNVQLLQNPFDFSDEQIQSNAYRTHFHHVEKCDVTSLHTAVTSLHTAASEVINHSIEITDTVITKGSQLSDRFREDASNDVSWTINQEGQIIKDPPMDPSITSQQLIAKLKRIACQMVCTARGDHYAHHTTMLILEQLKEYEWEEKALIVQAAFALEYGKFLYHPLTRQCQQSEKSLAGLNGLLMIQHNTEHITFFNSVVKKVMQVIECITERKRLAGVGIDIIEVPTFAETADMIVAVYWVIFTFVTCTGQIHDLTTDNKVHSHELSKKIESKLDVILRNFEKLLEICSMELGDIHDCIWRWNIVSLTGKDIVEVLEALIISGENRDSRHKVYYNGLTEEQVEIEEFEKKYVLLFISGLEHIEDEIKLLNSINEKLKEKQREVEGYRSEDFKILWIPIVDEWNEECRQNLESNLLRTKFGWYVVKYFNFKTGIKLIKEVFEYKEKPVIPLINPQGRVENIDTKQIISVCGIDGFPFRTSDHIRLTGNWFWSEMRKHNPKIGDMIKEDGYLFIYYGGTDTVWIQEFTTAMEALKKEVEEIKMHMDLTLTIESYQLGKEMKGDFIDSEIKRLLFLKQDAKGWVILSRGYNVKLFGYGEAMCRTVKEFDTWRWYLRYGSFDEAFKEHYEGIKDIYYSKKSEENVISYGHATDIVERKRITCPKMDCRCPTKFTFSCHCCFL